MFDRHTNAGKIIEKQVLCDAYFDLSINIGPTCLIEAQLKRCEVHKNSAKELVCMWAMGEGMCPHDD